MRRIEIGGSVKHHLWEKATIFPQVEVTQLPPRHSADRAYQSYSQTIFLPVQISTYMETAAHMDQSRPSIDQVPVERLITEAVVLKTPLEAKGAITPELLQKAKETQGATIKKGDSLIVATGWGVNWDEPTYISHSPYFTTAAIEWILGHEVGLLGSDSAQWDNGTQGFFPRFFEPDILLLAPLINLMSISQTRVQLLAFPMKIEGACAAPARAFVIEE